MRLKLAYFYPTRMNLYGDQGNIQILFLRCRWRGIDLSVTEFEIGDQINLTEYDLAFLGGGQDREQSQIGRDLLRTKAAELRSAVNDGLVMLAVCGGFQLLGEYYQLVEGQTLEGISIFDARTERGVGRAIGNILTHVGFLPGESQVLIGFENHSGRTYLGPGCRPLGKVLKGFGNNGEDRLEGARYRNCFGTYLHGPLLPKNPAFADYLIRLALERRYGKTELAPLDDLIETETRRRLIKRIKKSLLLKRRVG